MTNILISRDVKKHYLEGSDFWVDLKTELSGFEEQNRAAIVLEVRKDQPPEVLEQIENLSVIAEEGRQNELSEEELEKTVVNAMTPAMNYAIAEINRRVAEFDLQHYIAGWSSTVNPTVQNYRLLDNDIYRWLVTTINKHRAGVMPKQGDLSIPTEDGEPQPGNLKDSSGTGSGEPETPLNSPPTVNSITDASVNETPTIDGGCSSRSTSTVENTIQDPGPEAGETSHSAG